MKQPAKRGKRRVGLAGKAPENTAQKQSGRFQKGQSGNPNGRPPGSRNKTTLAVDALLDGEAETLTRKAIELAKTGDVTALRLCLDRIAPVRKDRLAGGLFHKSPRGVIFGTRAGGAAVDNTASHCVPWAYRLDSGR